jgi:hypothetical protein
LVIVFASAILGMLMRRKLPESHLSDETKSLVTLSMGVVGTLTALVLRLLIATASSTFNTRNQEITDIAFYSSPVKECRNNVDFHVALPVSKMPVIRNHIKNSPDFTAQTGD